MPNFDLTVTVDDNAAELRLLDDKGAQRAYHRVDFQQLAVSDKRRLFDLRSYLDLFVDVPQRAAEVAKTGVLIAQKVLGPGILELLWRPESQRTLRVQLPAADAHGLAAAMARIPWEIARPKTTEPTLAERALIVRVVHDMNTSPTEPIALEPDEELRVLFVFAAAPGSQPLAARQERRELRHLFEREVYPRRRVVAHMLDHGVTRARLKAQVEENGGYHIVHWSGHGHLDGLELMTVEGGRDAISGSELRGLFVEAGGVLPSLMFLSACHSGDVLRVKDWDDFFRRARGAEAATKGDDTAPFELDDTTSFTGTAYALLSGGIPAIVAMRYAVRDSYARDLAVEFYRALLAHAKPKSAGTALTLARRTLSQKQDPHHDACDHATPVFFGAEQPEFTLASGASTARDARDPIRMNIPELTSSHEHFVGRGRELGQLGAGFIGVPGDPAIRPVALITGLGGMGKTALVAEALELWKGRFEWVLVYQAKTHALDFEDWLGKLHRALDDEQLTYHKHVARFPADSLDPQASRLTGVERQSRLIDNLVRALKHEPILLVLDNLETLLRPHDEASQDPAWDACLTALSTRLGVSGSRMLITSRRPFTALTTTALVLRLGPLQAGEALLYVQQHPTLRALVVGTAEHQKLVRRLLAASRLHPLLMDRLARLAEAPEPRAELHVTLATLEQKGGLAQLPELFAATRDGAAELAYLEDALETSLDELIARVAPEARRVLWLVARANEPVTLRLVEAVWEELAGTAPKSLGPHVERLVAVGLLTADHDSPTDHNPVLSCHEVVRERMNAWMEREPADRAGWSEVSVRREYAGFYGEYCVERFHEDGATAIEAGSRALVYAVQTSAWDVLGSFAGRLVTATDDPRVLDRLLPHLRSATTAAPEGRVRTACLLLLADTLRKGGRPDLSRTIYEQAAAQTRAAIEDESIDTREALGALAAILCNLGHALTALGDLTAARQCHRDATEAERKGGEPAVEVIGSELEALRIDIMLGKVEAAWPDVQSRLAQVRAWWQEHQNGNAVEEAPDAEGLARCYISALDIADDAHRARMDPSAALKIVDELLALQRTLQRSPDELADTRLNRAVLLQQLGQSVEAQQELEHCAVQLEHSPGRKAAVLSSLANVLAERGDLPEAIKQVRRALALENTLPRPEQRSTSHGNLAILLEMDGSYRDPAESSRHLLAGLIYRMVAQLAASLQSSLRNYAVFLFHALRTDTPHLIPTVADLVADPAFDALARWLQDRNVSLDDLQAAVDDELQWVRDQVDSEPAAE